MPAPRRRATRSSAWCAVPMWLALLPLLVLGLWWPQAIWNYFDVDRARAVAGGAMTGRTEQRHERASRSCRSTPDELPQRCGDLLQRGGRMQMAYAWYPRPGGIELRYRRQPRAEANDFFMLALRAARPGAEPRGDLPAARLVRARDHRPVRGRVRRPSRAQPPGAARRARSRSLPPLRPGLSGRHAAAVRAGDGGAAGDRQAPMCSACRSGRCAPTWSNRRVHLLLCRRAHPPLHPQLFFKHRGMEKRFEGRSLAQRRRAGRAGLRRRQLRPCAGLLPGGRSRPPAASCRRAPDGCACCSPNSSGSTTTCTISAISPTRRRSRSARPRASCSRSAPSRSTARLTGSRFLRSLLIPGGLRRDLRPEAWLGEALEALRAEIAAYTRDAREHRTAISTA